MGLLKWLKRETEISPNSKRRISEPPPFGNTTKVSRNESYLKALTKFNKWRQVHLSTHSRPSIKHNLSKSLATTPLNLKNASTSDNVANASTSSTKSTIINKVPEASATLTHSIYEEIDGDNDSIMENYFSNSLLLMKRSSKNLFLREFGSNPSLFAVSSINIENQAFPPLHNNGNMPDLPEAKEALIQNLDEPEYATPFSNYSKDISGATAIFEDIIEENFEFLNENCTELFGSRANLLVTDLDQSQEKISLFDESYDEKKGRNLNFYVSQSEMQDFIDLMVYPLSQIESDIGKLNFKASNSFMQHGRIDHMEVSYQCAKGNSSEAINNNFQILRKLRHPNIVLLMGVSLTIKATIEALIFEPLKNSLFEVIHFERNPISLENCLRYALQITNGTIYLHKIGFIHSNICSENIWVCRDTEVVKIGGFEMSSVLHIPCNKKSNYNISFKPTQLGTAYRQQHAKHFYQAPELLSATENLIEPKPQSDVYGICLTLWEMINCVIPYTQFTQTELVKIFETRNAQLPTYRIDRYKPFKTLLEEGLNIQVECRFPNAVTLKSALQRVDLSKKERSSRIPVNNFRSALNRSVDQYVNYTRLEAHTPGTVTTRSAIKCREQPYERRPSNSRRSRSGNISRLNHFTPKAKSKRSFSSVKGSNLGNSPPLTNSMNTWNIESDAPNISVQCYNNASPRTPNRKYSVNIRITSKNSPSYRRNETDCGSEGLGNDGEKNETFREKTNKFHTKAFATSSPHTSNNFFEIIEDSELCIENKLSNSKQEARMEADKDLNKRCQSNDLVDEQIEPTGVSTRKEEMVNTEDFYIDDDIPSICKFGTNIELNLNYFEEADEESDR